MKYIKMKTYYRVLYDKHMRLSKCATWMCWICVFVFVPVVSNGRQPTKIQLLVFFEVETSGWSLWRGHDLLLNTTVNVHYGHRGFVDKKTLKKQHNGPTEMIFKLYKWMIQRNIVIIFFDVDLYWFGFVPSHSFTVLLSCQLYPCIVWIVVCTLFLVSWHGEGFPEPIIVAVSWRGTANPWAKVKVHLHLALWQLQGHEVLLQRQQGTCCEELTF